MVKILFDQPLSCHTFHSSLADCQRLHEIFNIDFCGLGMIANDMTGFHCLGREVGGKPSSYYLQCSAYKFVWSYDTSNQSTKAIVFICNTRRGLKAFEDFTEAMKANAELVSHPLYLPLSGAAQALEFMDSLLRQQYGKCRIVEDATGFHPWRTTLEAREGLEELSMLSQQMTALAVENAMITRRIKQWKIAMEAFELILKLDKQVPNRVRSQHEEDTPLVSVAIHLIKGKLEVMEIDFN